MPRVDGAGVRGIRSSHLLAPSKPFPQSQAHSASFSGQATSPTPRLSLSHEPPAGTATHSSCVSGLSLLGTERRELTEKLEEAGLGVNQGQQEGQGGQEGRRGVELACPCDPDSGHSGAPQGWSIQASKGGHLDPGVGWSNQSIFPLSLVWSAEEGDLCQAGDGLRRVFLRLSPEWTGYHRLHRSCSGPGQRNTKLGLEPRSVVSSPSPASLGWENQNLPGSLAESSVQQSRSPV